MKRPPSDPPKIVKGEELESLSQNRIDLYLVQGFALSRKKAKLLLDKKQVLINGQRARMAKTPLKVGDKIEVIGSSPDSKKLKLDNYLLIVNKPAGIPVVKQYKSNDPHCFLYQVKEYCQQGKLLGPNNYLELLHRLDKETSGILVFIKDPQLAKPMQEQFKKNQFKKVYIAISQGKMDQRTMTYKSSASKKEKASETRFKIIKKRAKNVLCIEAKPITGRTHQIRIHLAELNCPIIGDKQYGQNPPSELDKQTPHHLLHAYKLEFIHPISKEVINLKAPLPSRMKSYKVF